MGDSQGASHGEEDEEGHHQTEGPPGLRKGKAQNGLEELLLKRWAPGIANNQAAEHCSNASPEPATPTVAAPAPINLATGSMSQETIPDWVSGHWSGELLFRWDRWSTQEASRHRPDCTPGTMADQSQRLDGAVDLPIWVCIPAAPCPCLDPGTCPAQDDSDNFLLLPIPFPLNLNTVVESLKCPFTSPLNFFLILSFFFF